tara:strand:- start:258 stop:869 length:612 start_codon:yes stop_codon:yes gene_type:complete
MSNWNINKLKKERSKIIERTQIGLNNLKQRQRLIDLNNKRKGIMSNREKRNHKKYIKKHFKDIYRTKIEKIDPLTEKIKVLSANNLTNSRIRHSNALNNFLNERKNLVKPKRLLNNFKTVENKPRKLNQKNKWEIDYLKREIFKYEGNISILDNKEKKAIKQMKNSGASNANIKNRKEIFNRNKRKYRLKLNKAKKDLKNIMP